MKSLLGRIFFNYRQRQCNEREDGNIFTRCMYSCSLGTANLELITQRVAESRTFCADNTNLHMLVSPKSTSVTDLDLSLLLTSDF